MASYRPSGAKAKIPAAAVAEIKEILGTEKGFRTYKEIHQLVVNKYKTNVGYSTVHHLVRYQLAAKAKSPRPSNPKKEAEVTAFKETIEDKFKQILAERPKQYPKVRLWTQDETRIGLLPIHRKRITAKGVQPKISSELKREYYYLFGLIEPLTGKDFMLELP